MLVSDPLMMEMYNVWDSCHEQFKHIFGGKFSSSASERRIHSSHLVRRVRRR